MQSSRILECHLVLLRMEQLYNKVSNKQILGLRHELAVGSGRVVSEAGFAGFPSGEDDDHLTAVLDEHSRCLATGRPEDRRFDLFLEDRSELPDMVVADRFTDNHPNVHVPPFREWLRA